MHAARAEFCSRLDAGSSVCVNVCAMRLRELWLMIQCMRLPFDDQVRREAFPVLLSRFAPGLPVNDEGQLELSEITRVRVSPAVMARG